MGVHIDSLPFSDTLPPNSFPPRGFRDIRSLRLAECAERPGGVEKARIGAVQDRAKWQITHVMYDGYLGDQEKMADVPGVYEMCYAIARKLKIGDLERVHVLPYFTGLVPEDSGISALFLYPRGHFTVHTFDKKQTVFVDFAVIDESVADPAKAIRDAMRETFDVERDETFARGSNPVDDPGKIPDGFGPHLTFQGQLSPEQITLDWMYDFLGKMPKAIEMTPISSPTVISSIGKDGHKYRDGMAVIAESHITIHADEDGRYFFDIFSCKAFDVDRFMKWATESGLNMDPSSVTLAMRGKDFPRLHTTRAKFLNVLRDRIDKKTIQS